MRSKEGDEIVDSKSRIGFLGIVGGRVVNSGM